MGFTIKEIMNLMNIYGKKIMDVINDNIYLLREHIDFKKLDKIFLDSNDPEDERRMFELKVGHHRFQHSMKDISIR